MQEFNALVEARDDEEVVVVSEHDKPRFHIRERVHYLVIVFDKRSIIGIANIFKVHIRVISFLRQRAGHGFIRATVGDQYLEGKVYRVRISHPAKGERSPILQSQDDG